MADRSSVAASVASGDPTQAWRNARASYPIRRVAVLGAGTMGARIAAHVANAGFPVLLLDLSSAQDRNRLAVLAIEGLKKTKPAAFTSPAFSGRITPGNFDDDLARLEEYDWVIEAVAESMEVKRGLLGKVIPRLRGNAILTTNTSGLPVGEIARDFPAGLRRRWLGTHFFNPPRYMQLLEIIPTSETDPEAAASVAQFAGLHLGKVIVPAKDTPNFIANRIGAFAMLNTVRAMRGQGLTIEEADALTGAPLGWPKTGTFRLADMVGIDVLASVVRNFAANVKDEHPDPDALQTIEKLVERKWLGDKTGQGFYKKRAAADGGEERLVLDLDSFEYRPAQKPKLPELELTKSIESLPERIRALLAGGPESGKAAAFYWTILPQLWAYAAGRLGEVSDSLADIDRAMRAGFNWALGPFEMWDAAGVARTVEQMRASGQTVPAAAERLLAGGGSSWYRKAGAECFDPRLEDPGLDSQAFGYLPVDPVPSPVTLAGARRSHGVVSGNPGASLIDIGEGIACIEFHSKMNTLGQDIVAFLRQLLSPESEAVRSFAGFVITSDAANFSAGANILQLLLAAQEEEWEEIELYIRAFQEATQAIKFCPRPVVAAPFGLCLGGGTEVSMHACLRQPHIELYMGLVETGIGLVPGGGGCKEMALRAIEAARAVRDDPRGDSVEIYAALRGAFETIALAKVSTSAVEAVDLRLLRPSDAITMNRGRLLHDARLQALKLVELGYAPPLPRSGIPAPGENVLANLQLGIHGMREAGFISDHDVTVARHAARVLCGGAVTPGTLLSERHFLDLEVEAFLSLCGERKTQERIAFTLKTGKPLRN